ncbi:MAG: putative capsid protein [Utsjoki toti-like virus]|nr:MAG: putative capsid protein [Utsjoki toti-like virus]
MRRNWICDPVAPVIEMIFNCGSDFGCVSAIKARKSEQVKNEASGFGKSDEGNGSSGETDIQPFKNIIEKRFSGSLGAALKANGGSKGSKSGISEEETAYPSHKALESLKVKPFARVFNVMVFDKKTHRHTRSLRAEVAAGCSTLEEGSLEKGAGATIYATTGCCKLVEMLCGAMLAQYGLASVKYLQCALALVVVTITSMGGWLRDLTAEGIEANPGPGISMGGGNTNTNPDVEKLKNFEIGHYPAVGNVAITHELFNLTAASENLDNRFGPHHLDREMLWAMANDKFTKPHGAIAGYYHQARTPYELLSPTGLKVKQYLVNSIQFCAKKAMERTVMLEVAETTHGFGAKLPEFAALNSMTLDSETKSMIQLMGNYRDISVNNWHAHINTLLGAAGHGGSLVTFYVKAWLDFMLRDFEARVGKKERELVPIANTLAALKYLKRKKAPQDTADTDVEYVTANVDAFTNGSKHLFSLSRVGEPANMVKMARRYASAWPQEDFKLMVTEQSQTIIDEEGNEHVLAEPKAYEHHHIASLIKIPGAEEFVVLKGSTNTAEITNDAYTPKSREEILGFMNYHMNKTGSYYDCMVAFELASAMAMGGQQSILYGYTRHDSWVDAMWSGGDIRLPTDNTLKAFFQPFVSNLIPGSMAVDLVKTDSKLIFPMMRHLHLMISMARQETLMMTSITRECYISPNDKAKQHLHEMTDKKGNREMYSRVDALTATNSSWMWGFGLRDQTLRAFSFPQDWAKAGTWIHDVKEHCIPAMWSGLEGVQFALSINERYMPAITGMGVRWPKDKAHPLYHGQDRPKEVRLARTAPPLAEFYWSNDSGPARNANVYWACVSAYDMGMSRSMWQKPYQANFPDKPETFIDVDSCVGVGMTHLLAPGQFPTYDPTTGEQYAWGVKLPETIPETEARRLVLGASDCGMHVAFQNPFGAIVEDMSRITYYIPAIEEYFMQPGDRMDTNMVVDPLKEVPREGTGNTNNSVPTASGNDDEHHGGVPKWQEQRGNRRRIANGMGAEPPRNPDNAMFNRFGALNEEMEKDQIGGQTIEPSVFVPQKERRRRSPKKTKQTERDLASEDKVLKAAEEESKRFKRIEAPQVEKVGQQGDGSISYAEITKGQEKAVENESNVVGNKQITPDLVEGNDRPTSDKPYLETGTSKMVVPGADEVDEAAKKIGMPNLSGGAFPGAKN